jgi:hypothetical protein
MMDAPHTHPEAEVLVWVGFDPEKPEYFGAEIEQGCGRGGETILFSEPTVVIAPGGVVHGPATTNWIEKPFGFMVFCLDGKHESKYKKDGETFEL